MVAVDDLDFCIWHSPISDCHEERVQPLHALKEKSLLAEDQCVMVIVLEFLDLETIFPNDTLSDEDMNETHSFLLLSVEGAWI